MSETCHNGLPFTYLQSTAEKKTTVIHLDQIQSDEELVEEIADVYNSTEHKVTEPIDERILTARRKLGYLAVGGANQPAQAENLYWGPYANHDISDVARSRTYTDKKINHMVRELGGWKRNRVVLDDEAYTDMSTGLPVVSKVIQCQSMTVRNMLADLAGTAPIKNFSPAVQTEEDSKDKLRHTLLLIVEGDDIISAGAGERILRAAVSYMSDELKYRKSDKRGIL